MSIAYSFQDAEGYSYELDLSVALTEPSLHIEYAPPGYTDIWATAAVTGTFANTTPGRVAINDWLITIMAITTIPTSQDDTCRVSELYGPSCAGVPIAVVAPNHLPEGEPEDLTFNVPVEFRAPETDAQTIADRITGGDITLVAAITVEIRYSAMEAIYPGRVVFTPSGELLAECPAGNESDSACIG